MINGTSSLFACNGAGTTKYAIAIPKITSAPGDKLNKYRNEFFIDMKNGISKLL